MRPRRTAAAGAALLSVLVILGLASPAAAHDPIFLTDEQTTPEAGPYFPDGTVSWAVYGSLAVEGDTRGFEFDMAEGAELFLSILIPNVEPEVSLTVDELPTMTLTLPDGTSRTIDPVIGDPFDEPFSGTSYLTLHQSREPALAGLHSVVVTARGPSRFTVAVGEREVFGSPAERVINRPTGFAAIGAPLDAWYTTPADGTAEAEQAVSAADPNPESAVEEPAEPEPTTTTITPTTTTPSTELAVQAEEEAAPPASDDVADNGAGLGLAVGALAVVTGGAGALIMRRRSSGL